MPAGELRAEPLAVDVARHGELLDAHPGVQVHVATRNQVEGLAHAGLELPVREADHHRRLAAGHDGSGPRGRRRAARPDTRRRQCRGRRRAWVGASSWRKGAVEVRQGLADREAAALLGIILQETLVVGPGRRPVAEQAGEPRDLDQQVGAHRVGLAGGRERGLQMAERGGVVDPVVQPRLGDHEMQVVLRGGIGGAREQRLHRRAAGPQCRLARAARSAGGSRASPAPSRHQVSSAPVATSCSYSRAAAAGSGVIGCICQNRPRK